MPGKRDSRPIRRLVVGISASPRRGGNTDTLLDEALKGAKAAGASVEKIFLNDLVFKPCQECGGCGRTGRCVIRDGMESVFRSVEASDALIIASPIFFGTVTAQLKAMIDRFQGYWVAKYILKKRLLPGKARKGLFLSAAGSPRRSFFTCAGKVVRNLFATLDMEYSGELFLAGAEDKDAARHDEKALKRTFSLGIESAAS